jgi:RimJ/RimL family protein N-acetyltransferase
VTGPVNEASIAFHWRLGFEIEAEVDDYDGVGAARVLLRKRL